MTTSVTMEMKGYSGEADTLVGNGHNSSSNETSQGDRMPFMMMLLKKRLHYLPIVTVIFIIASFVISYGIAVSNGHVEPDFPYISTCLSSYTAIEAPERCIFAQLVNVGAFMLAANIYIRYLQMREVLCLLNGAIRDKRVNKASLALGWVSAFGLTMVANFQTVVMRPGHYTGAFLAFMGGMAYCWMQTSLSIRYSRWTCVAVSQLANSLVLTFGLVTFIISKAVYKSLEIQGYGTKWDTLRGVYLVSAVSEWLTAMSIVTFTLTYYRDFSRVVLKSPSVSIMNRSTVLEDFRFGSLSYSGATPNGRQNGHASAPV